MTGGPQRCPAPRRVTPEGAGTRAVWTYTLTARPTWLAPVADPVGRWVLGREIRRRIEAYAAACRDPEVLAAVALAHRPEGGDPSP